MMNTILSLNYVKNADFALAFHPVTQCWHLNVADLGGGSGFTVCLTDDQLAELRSLLRPKPVKEESTAARWLKLAQPAAKREGGAA